MDVEMISWTISADPEDRTCDLNIIQTSYRGRPGHLWYKKFINVKDSQVILQI